MRETERLRIVPATREQTEAMIAAAREGQDGP